MTNVPRASAVSPAPEPFDVLATVEPKSEPWAGRIDAHPEGGFEVALRPVRIMAHSANDAAESAMALLPADYSTRAMLYDVLFYVRNNATLKEWTYRFRWQSDESAY